MAQDLQGKTFLVTGGSSGIGRATAVDLGRRGGKVFIATRNEEKTKPVLDEIGENAEYLHLDLGDLDSVRQCAKEFLARNEPLHVLINNGGVAGQRGLTANGFELAFGVNHLGHFALTTALLDRLAESAPARIVNVSSDSHYQAKGIDFAAVRRPTASVTGMREYSVSKLSNVLFTQELARRLDGRGVTAYALHPGVVASEIWRRVPWPVRPLIKLRMISPEEGARTSLYCATSPEVADVTGRFYDHSREREPSAVATAALAGELWQRSEAWIAA